MDFEKKLKEIEQIAARLQREEVGINEGIQLFEKSVVLAKECMDELDDCKVKIESVKRQMELAFGGEPENFGKKGDK